MDNTLLVAILTLLVAFITGIITFMQYNKKDKPTKNIKVFGFGDAIGRDKIETQINYKSKK